jgi:hypothetical protein
VMGIVSIDEPLDITVETGTPQPEMDAVAAIFQSVGLRANVREGYIRLSADLDLPWVVMLMAPLTWVALQFAGGVATKAGADAWDAYRRGGWRGLRRFIDEVVHARGREGTITVRDPTGPDVRLHAAIPDEALSELADLDWEAMSDGYLSWEEGQWHYLGGGAPKAVRAPRR